TAATIAFNGAAAWPDPLGVGMHAVIPILFVVSIEAARHAIGRIADITADKHMEGVRLSRWLLCPMPTFLLWRRMKLWELRSYEQVIKLEQDRLVYQARLHSRFGRAWRRKAPVESLMPLRLARYGVPLAQTAPEGFAAAGIEARLLPAAPQLTVPELEPPTHAAEVAAAEPSSPSFAQQTEHSVETVGPIDYFSAYEDFLAEYQVRPTASQFAHYLRDEWGAAQDDGSPLPRTDLTPLLAEYAFRSEASVGRHTMGNGEEPQAEVPVSEETWAAFYWDVARAYVEEFGASPDTAVFAQYLRSRYNLDAPEPHLLPAEVTAEQLPAPGAADTMPAAGLAPSKTPSDDLVPVPSQRDRAQIDVALDASTTHDGAWDAGEELARLTNPDRYYLAYQNYVDTHGAEPKGGAAWEEVSQQLAASGVLGDKGRPVSPSTLRRYALEQRIYRRWADAYERLGEPPTYEALLNRLADDGIKAGNRQLTLDDLQRGEHLASGFERRYHALRSHHGSAHP
ncbi:DUF2637 domain-containing protein, partial [Streptomyces sp. NPDC001893]|uniref:DUF2637 domain-containing protein n=1 Tax=Streptomyces sp. NPDC001893 TaxID=3154530 RepID=UPI003328B577